MLARDGRVFEGVNVENAAYPLGIRAEKSAIAQAVAAGCGPGDLEAIGITASPCGAAVNGSTIPSSTARRSRTAPASRDALACRAASRRRGTCRTATAVSRAPHHALAIAEDAVARVCHDEVVTAAAVDDVASAARRVDHVLAGAGANDVVPPARIHAVVALEPADQLAAARAVQPVGAPSPEQPARIDARPRGALVRDGSASCPGYETSMVLSKTPGCARTVTDTDVCTTRVEGSEPAPERVARERARAPVVGQRRHGLVELLHDRRRRGLRPHVAHRQPERLAGAPARRRRRGPEREVDALEGGRRRGARPPADEPALGHEGEALSVRPDEVHGRRGGAGACDDEGVARG